MLICDYEYCGTYHRWREVLETLNTRDWNHKLAVQVRIKNQTATQSRLLAEEAKSILPSTIQTLLNGDVQSAVELGFDGVHLPKNQINAVPIALGELNWVSVAMHQVSELSQVVQLGAHSIVVAPLFQPQWKTGTPIGLTGLSKFVTQSNVPVYALGGISRSNIDRCVQQGVHGIAVLSSVLQAKQPVPILEAYLECFNPTIIPN